MLVTTNAQPAVVAVAQQNKKLMRLLVPEHLPKGFRRHSNEYPTKKLKDTADNYLEEHKSHEKLHPEYLIKKSKDTNDYLKVENSQEKQQSFTNTSMQRQSPDGMRDTTGFLAYNHNKKHSHRRWKEPTENYLDKYYPEENSQSQFTPYGPGDSSKIHKVKKHTHKKRQKAPDDRSDLYQQLGRQSHGPTCGSADITSDKIVIPLRHYEGYSHPGVHNNPDNHDYQRDESNSFTYESGDNAVSDGNIESSPTIKQYNLPYLPRSWKDSPSSYLKVYDNPEKVRDFSNRPRSSQLSQNVTDFTENNRLSHTWERSDKKNIKTSIDENRNTLQEIPCPENRNFTDMSDLTTAFTNRVVDPGESPLLSLYKVNSRENLKCIRSTADPMQIVHCSTADHGSASNEQKKSSYEFSRQYSDRKIRRKDGREHRSKIPVLYNVTAADTVAATNNYRKVDSQHFPCAKNDISANHLKVPDPRQKSRSYSSLPQDAERSDISVQNLEGYSTWERSKTRKVKPKRIIAFERDQASKQVKRTALEIGQTTKVVLKTSPKCNARTRVFIGSSTIKETRGSVLNRGVTSRVAFKAGEDEKEPLKDAIIPFGCAGYYLVKVKDKIKDMAIDNTLTTRNNKLKNEHDLVKDENNNNLFPMPKKKKSRKRISRESCESSDSVIAAMNSDSSTDDRSSARLEFWDWIDDEFIGPFRICGRGLTKPFVGEASNFYIFTEQDCSEYLKVFIAGPGMYPPKVEFDCLTETFYRIVYWPERVGHYSIHVKWKGWHVQNSPFKVTARLPKCIVWIKRPKK